VERVLIVAEPPFVMRTMRLALSQTSGLELVGVCNPRKPLRARLLELRPQIVLIEDAGRPQVTLELVRDADELVPDAKRLVLAPSMNCDWLDDAIDAGADAVLCKTLHPVVLGTLLRETLRGNIVQRVRRARPADAGCPLTAREIQILGLVAQGHTNSHIARELWVTEQTVKFHLRNTYRKLGVANRTEASAYAYMNDLLAPQLQVAT
jgi:DNA-binding NarL/FixJ family response regulator